jgi:hypothetical protein
MLRWTTRRAHRCCSPSSSPACRLTARGTRRSAWRRQRQRSSEQPRKRANTLLPPREARLTRRARPRHRRQRRRHTPHRSRRCWQRFSRASASALGSASLSARVWALPPERRSRRQRCCGGRGEAARLVHTVMGSGSSESASDRCAAAAVAKRCCDALEMRCERTQQPCCSRRCCAHRIWRCAGFWWSHLLLARHADAAKRKAARPMRWRRRSEAGQSCTAVLCSACIYSALRAHAKLSTVAQA